MSIMMIRVRSSNDPRAPIQNGYDKIIIDYISNNFLLMLTIFFRFWAIKYLLIIGGIIGAFFIPEKSFGTTWMYFGMIGGFLFIIIQLILIVDLAYSWADAWIQNSEEEGESKKWYA